MLRRSPRVVLPQISGNSRPADFGGRLSILGGTSRAWAAGTDALPRRSLPALYCCPYRRQQSGGFRRAASYIGQIVRGQWVQTFCRVALPASFCCQYTATAIQRSRPTPCTTAKLCYCKSCVTAFGGWPRASRAWQRAQMLCCAALPASFCIAYIRHQQAGGFRRPAGYTGGQAVRGQRVQTFRCAALPRAVLLPLISRGRQRFGGFLRSRPTPRTAAKLCFAKAV